MSEDSKLVRYFLYQDGKNVVFGRQNIRYEPNESKNIFGSVFIEVLFPTRKEVRLSFSLDEYPNTTCIYNEKGVLVGHRSKGENVVPMEVGMLMMKQEANRSSMLATRSIAKIDKDSFNYSNMKIFSDKLLDENGTGKVEGVISSDVLYLRKGDIVTVMTLDEVDENVFEWVIRYDRCDHGKSVKDYIRKIWTKYFNKELYSKRYSNGSSIPGCTTSTFHVELDKVIVQGDPVEDGTIR